MQLLEIETDVSTLVENVKRKTYLLTPSPIQASITLAQQKHSMAASQP
jgi:hypothetical protein